MIVHFSWPSVNPRWWFTRHGAERRDGAGCDAHVRVFCCVVTIPHGWRRVECLKSLAEEKRRLIESLEIERFRATGRFS